MKHASLAAIILALTGGPAWADFESMMNPMPMGAVTPMGMAVPLMGMGGMYPAMQVAPNLMSFGHLNQMTNPYLGGAFVGNPYLQPLKPMAPASSFAIAPGSPGMALPFSYVAPPPAPARPAQPAMPYRQSTAPQARPGMTPLSPWMSIPPGASQQPSTPASMPFDPMSWLGMFARPSAIQPATGP